VATCFGLIRPKPDNIRKFYLRVVNKTNIIFSNDGVIVLNEYLKYNSNHKHKNRIRTLALEAERAINQSPTFEEEHIGFQVAHNMTFI
jgi:hypothetical protein